MTENTNVFKTSMDALKEKIGNMEINAQTVITVLRFSMEVVEATQLKGEAQKDGHKGAPQRRASKESHKR